MTDTPAASSLPRDRIAMIDTLRGFVIIIMALDHTREFTHASGWAYNALGPEAHPLIYATRWIIHLCAPTFVLLAGVSIRLQSVSGMATPSLSARIAKRGVWLIFLELTVIRIQSRHLRHRDHGARRLGGACNTEGENGARSRN